MRLLTLWSLGNVSCSLGHAQLRLDQQEAGLPRLMSEVEKEGGQRGKRVRLRQKEGRVPGERRRGERGGERGEGIWER